MISLLGLLYAQGSWPTVSTLLFSQDVPLSAFQSLIFIISAAVGFTNYHRTLKESNTVIKFTLPGNKIKLRSCRPQNLIDSCSHKLYRCSRSLLQAGGVSSQQQEARQEKQERLREGQDALHAQRWSSWGQNEKD